MTVLLPIVEELADCQTDAERADWLLRVPVGVICRDSSSIRRILMEARFALGVQAVRSFLRDIVRKGGAQ